MTDFSTGAISISSTTTTVEDTGGFSLEIVGVFRNETALVELVKGSLRYRCYSGNRGQGYRPSPRSPTRFAVATPPVPAALYDVVVTQGSHVATAAGALLVAPANKHLRAYALRKSFPPWYAAGPRKETQEVLDLFSDFGIDYTDASLTSDSLSSITPTVSNPAALPLTYTLQSGTIPTGMALNATTGAITGTPAGGSNSDVTIRATSLSGLFKEDTFNILVVNPAFLEEFEIADGW